MKKGNMAMAGAMVVMAIIALAVTDSIVAPICNCIDADSMNATLILNTWVNNTCDGTKCESDYSVTCGDTELVVGDDYSIDDCDIRLEDVTYNNTSCRLDYTIEGDNYHGSDIFGVVMCNIPIIAAVTTLLLAGTWIFLKG